MQTDSTDGAVKLGAFLVVLGGMGVYSSLKRFKQRRCIEDTPSSEIRSAAQGLVEIQGHALPRFGSSYRCMIGRPCVYRDLKIEKYVKRGKNSSWETVFQETEGAEFIVSDGTGIAQVLVSSADLMLLENPTLWVNLTNEARERLAESHGARVEGLSPDLGFFSLFTGRSLRVTERVIRVAGPVYVRGYFQTVKEMNPYLIEPQYLNFLARIGELRKQPSWKMKAFDLDRDGRITENEIAKGSEKLLYLAKGEVTPEEKTERVAIQGILRFAPEHGLVIGDSHQEFLIKRLGSSNVFRLIGGAAAIAAGVGVFIALVVS